ncbi:MULTISPECIES: radical SAM protein [unclassified Bradyrhizobium]|uniref:B12-binding domain-containing radical SAM protein n=1 Tax=unclassified Bradyrhizobium TaxID=2631580 RepID=UPI0029170612|nr:MULTISPECIES: radical SAM protein [unclassified Bradyrhizobium]
MIDVLLINPPGYRGRPRRGPYELATLAANLLAAGFRGELVDLQYETGEGRIAFPDGFMADITSLLKARPARVVLLTFRTTAGPWAHLIARECRRLYPEIALVAFAPRIEDRLRRFMRDDVTFDALCVSDPAETLLAAARAARTSGRRGLRYVPGLLVRTDEGLVETDATPIPEIWPRQIDSWISPDRSIAAIHVGRGCPDRCTFCAAHLGAGGQPRYQVPEEAARDAAIAFERLGSSAAGFVMLEAENLTSNPAWLDAFAAERRRLGVQFRWGAYGRIDHMDASMRRRLSDAGCCFLFIGIESGSANLQKVLGKHFDLSSVVPRITALHAAGIATQSSFIYGIPGETEDDLERTAHLMAEIAWAGGYVDWTPLRIEAGTTMERLTRDHKVTLMTNHELYVDLVKAGYDPRSVHPDIGYRMYGLDLPMLGSSVMASVSAWRTLLMQLPITTYVLAVGLALPVFQRLRQDAPSMEVSDLRRWAEIMVTEVALRALPFVQELAEYETGAAANKAKRYNLDLVYPDLRRDPRRIAIAFDFPWWSPQSSIAPETTDA